MTTHNGPLSDIEQIAFASLIKRDLDTEQCLHNQLLFVQAETNSAQLAAQFYRWRSKTATSALEASQSTITSLIWLQGTIQQAVNAHFTGDKSTEEIKPIWQRILPLAETLLQELNTIAAKTPNHAASLLAQAAEQDSIKGAAEKSLAAINQSLTSIRKCISEKKLLLHPLRRVPTEILAIVFQYVVNADRERIREGFLKSSVQPFKDTLHLAPFALAAVCRRWRSVSIAFPCLWTFLLLPRRSLTLNYFSRPPGVIGIDRFDRSLALSKDKELEVTIYVNPSPHYRIDYGISPYISKVGRTSRVAQLNIIGAQSIAAGLPNAKVVHIYGSTGYVQSTPFTLNVEAGAFLGTVEIVFHQSIPKTLSVTTLHTLHFHLITQVAGIQFLNILRSLPNLRHLLLTSPSDVTLQPQFFGFGAPSGPIMATSHLATLTVTSNFLPEISRSLLRGLSLPSLTTFILADIFNSGSAASVTGLQGVISTITHVELHQVSSTIPQAPTIRAILERIPNLLCFTLVGTSLGHGITALSSPPGFTVRKLVVKASDTDGIEVSNYVQKVRTNQVFGEVTVSLVDCPRILPHIRKLL